MLNYSVRPKRILIVDDEPTLAFFLKQSLQEAYPDYVIDQASSGEEAVTKLTYNQYHLLITDLKMPGISGFTLTEMGRSLQPHLKIIVMTAHGSREVEENIKALNVDGYLTKPFPTARLQELALQVLKPEGRVGSPT
jgi:CheY-like chemotaxis protein